MFDQSDIDRDGYLNFEELKSFWENLAKKKKMDLKIDEYFIGDFLTKAEVIDESGIGKADFLRYFRNIWSLAFTIC